MDAARLIEGYKHVLRTIYSSREYYDRALKCLARVIQDGPEPRHGRWLDEAAAFARVILRLGVLDHERREFWRYVRNAFSKHRMHFAHAMTLAAMGYHFRRLTEENCR
jgi:hypothetical protein